MNALRPDLANLATGTKGYKAEGDACLVRMFGMLRPHRSAF